MNGIPSTPSQKSIAVCRSAPTRVMWWTPWLWIFRMPASLNRRASFQDSHLVIRESLRLMPMVLHDAVPAGRHSGGRGPPRGAVDGVGVRLEGGVLRYRH